MTDNSNAAPERIWAWPDLTQEWAKDGGLGDRPYDHFIDGYTEYIRADLANAQIAAAYEAAALACHKYAWPDDGTYSPDQIDIEEAERATVSVCQDAILALTPDDAKAKLAAMLKAERAKAYERAERALWEMLCDDRSEFWSGHTKAVKEGIEAMQSLAACALAQENGK